MSKRTLLPAHMPEPWVRRGIVVEAEDGRHVAEVHLSVAEAKDPTTWGRAPDTAQRIVDCVNALEDCERPDEAVREARRALVLAYDWLMQLRDRLQRVEHRLELEHIFTEALDATGHATGHESQGLGVIWDAAAALGEEAEIRLARTLMGDRPAPPGATPCRSCHGLGMNAENTRECADCGGKGKV